MRAFLTIEILEDRNLLAVAFQALPVLPFSSEPVLDHAEAIFALGEQLGRQTNVVLKVGDSNSSPMAGSYSPGSTFLAPLGSPAFNPFTSGLFAQLNLLKTWAAYRIGPDSLAWQVPTATPGYTTSNVLTVLNREIATTNAGIALIMIGTNDVIQSGDPTLFAQNLTTIVDELMAAGVVPILSTIPNLNVSNGLYRSNVFQFNQVIANVAGQCAVPLWNTWAALNQLPNQGLDARGIHLSTSPNGGGSFFPGDLLYGQNVRNLEAMQILNWFQNSVAHAPQQDLNPLTTWLPLSASNSVYSVGREGEFSPTIDVRNGTNGALVDRFLGFGPTFSGGVQVATGDVTGDGFTDVVCGMASKGGTLNVFSGANGSLLAHLKPFGASYTGGLTVAVGDLNGNGVDEIVVGKASQSSLVEVYAFQGGSLILKTSFYPFPNLAPRGVSVAVANVQGVGREVVVGAKTSSPTVGLFRPDGTLTSILDTSGLPPGVGVTVAAVDLEGIGFDQLALAPVTGGEDVLIIDPATQTLLADFTLGVGSSGLRLGTIRSRTGGQDTLVVGNGAGAATTVLGFDDLSGTPFQLGPNPPGRAYGLYVG